MNQKKVRGIDREKNCESPETLRPPVPRYGSVCGEMKLTLKKWPPYCAISRFNL